MPAAIEYRCWSCRRDVPAADVARFPKGASGAFAGMAMCRDCAETRAARGPRRPLVERLDPEVVAAIRAADESAPILAARHGLSVSQVRALRAA